MQQTFHNAALSEKLLSTAFPFHLVTNDKGAIVSCGKSLFRKHPCSLGEADNLFENFRFQHPTGVNSIEELIENKDKLLVMESVQIESLVLRGQLIINDEGSAFLFLVSPWVTNAESLDNLGLSIDDFPIHSPTSDFIFVVQAQQVSLEESVRLSDELTQLNKDLEDRVASRTQALERQAMELKESKSVLEHEMNERHRVEIELRHAQKLESIGQLSAGIAHEINTPIQYIGNSLTFLKESLADLTNLKDIANDNTVYDNTQSTERFNALHKAVNESDLAYFCERGPKALDRALAGIKRVNEIVSAMNEFTHPDTDEMDKADINRTLKTVLTVAHNEYKYIADVECDFQKIPSIQCLLGDLNQVFLNLIVNSAHSIADKGGTKGFIQISTKMLGETILISIKDNGAGIPIDIQHRIFDPFFTTKEVGRGTGQGLSISHKIIVEKHHGRLYFETTPDKGTTFHIELPINQNNSRMVLAPNPIRAKAA